MGLTWVLAIRSNSPSRLTPLRLFAAALLCAVFAPLQSSYALEYLSAEDFVSGSFDGKKPAAATLWLNPAQQEAAKSILGHRFAGLRLRYWADDHRTAWVIDEIGKERPITVGIVIDGDSISRVEILAYRELRGGEVRHAFFREQFIGAELQEDYELSGRVDGITGATLSVRAVTNVSRLALFLHQEVTKAS